MDNSVETDWVAAWFDLIALWDTTISFWMSATFAVIVAIHALGERVTPSLKRLLAGLYGGFSLFTLVRLVGLAEDGRFISERLAEAQIRLRPEGFGWSAASEAILWWLVIGGIIATIHFILSAPRKFA